MKTNMASKGGGGGSQRNMVCKGVSANNYTFGCCNVRASFQEQTMRRYISDFKELAFFGFSHFVFRIPDSSSGFRFRIPDSWS